MKQRRAWLCITILAGLMYIKEVIQVKTTVNWPIKEKLIKTGTWNIKTLYGKEKEIVEKKKNSTILHMFLFREMYIW